MVTSPTGGQEPQWYFNTSTQQPELGKLSAASNRMGPYPSREEALRAWEIVKERNQKWEDDDQRWQGEAAGEPRSE